MKDDTPNNPIAYRPPKLRRPEINAMKEQSGLSWSAFITECIFGRSRHRPAEIRLGVQLLIQCTRIADRQRDHRFAETEETRLLQKAILAELVTIRNAIMAKRGRKS